MLQAVTELLEKGILINRTHEVVLRFPPPYIIEKKHVDEVVQALDLALTTRKTNNHKGHPSTSLKAGSGARRKAGTRS